MNLFECPRIDDAAGYVLSALPDSESESYRHHVTECDECAGKIAELGFVSHALLNAVPQLSAPPEIRDRVMAVVRAEADLLQAAGAGADRPARREPRRFGFGFARLRPLTAGVLATVLIALGIGVAVLVPGSPLCRTSEATVDPSLGKAPKVSLTTCGSDAQLAMSGINRPPDGRLYQLWLDDPNDAQPPKARGELFSPRNGEASVDVGDVEAGQVVMMTDEPEDSTGSLPTRTPVVKVSA